MCYAVDAEPPDLPISAETYLPPGISEHGGASFSERVVLRSQDGTQFSAFVARPDAPNGAGIVILPDVRGLFRFYEELAVRFAVAGVEAIAIDYFGRTAGLAPRPDDFEFMPHVQQTKADQISQDVAAAIAHLRGLPGVRLNGLFTVGFCFGGWNSFNQAASHHGLSGVIGFYGSPTSSRLGAPSPIDRIAEFECPVLGLFGGADQGIPTEDVHQFDDALTKAGIAHELHIYPGAPHSFFDRKYDDFKAESADAWNRMLTFISTYTPRAS
jgi:carboxymethylenebutenolidase